MSGWQYIDIDQLVASDMPLYLSGGDVQFDAAIGGRELTVTLSSVTGMIRFQEVEVLPAN